MDERKRSLRTWFRNLKRSSQIVLILSLLALIAVAAYAAGFLWKSASDSTSLIKDRYVELNLTGATATGTIRPGGTVSVAPTLTNDGDIPVTCFIRASVPLIGGTGENAGDVAYDYSVNGSWSVVDTDTVNGNRVIVYGYGTESELTVIGPGDSTDALTDAFTLKSSITGAQFNAMGSIDLGFEGFVVDSEAGEDPGTVWMELGQ